MVMRDITPYEVGTTDSPDEYVVWGKDESGADYRSRVIVTDCITPRDDKNLMALAIDNDSWEPFPNSYHGDISIDIKTALTGEAADKIYREAIEAVIDLRGLVAVLDYVGDVCRGKSQHISENWQDNALSRKWMSAAIHIEHCSNLVEMLKL
jgi:hypothetical protein